MPRPATTLEDALAACLDDLDRGASVAECLARYPAQAADLAPLLYAAERTRNAALPTLSLRGRAQGRQRMHAALAQRAPGVMLPAWAGGLAGTAILLLLVAGIWFSWPGRDEGLRGESTARPTTPTLAATAPPQNSPSPAPSLTPVDGGTTVTATATTTPGALVPTLPTPRATPPNAPQATTSAPGATPTLQPTTTAVPQPTETPEATESAEPRASTRTPSTSPPEPQPSATRGAPPDATPATFTITPVPQVTQPPQATPTPEREPSVTPDDDDRETPEPEGSS